MIAFFKTVKKGWIKNQVKGIVKIMLQIFFQPPWYQHFQPPADRKRNNF